MPEQERVGSNLVQEVELPKHEGSEKPADAVRPAALGPGSFTTYYTWRGNGTVQALRFNHGAVNANSRVFLSISEYGTNAAADRFIGSAPTEVLNVAPFNGGFFAWVVVGWSSPINIRFDVLVDP
jgi:hypothetical protein